MTALRNTLSGGRATALHSYDGLYRVRIGRYRLFYFVDTSERTILVVDIETREKAY